MKVEFITQPFLKYTSMKNDRRSSKNAILLLFRVFPRFFLLRTHYHFCRSTNCVYRRLTLLWFHTSLKKEKAESKKFCGSTASKEDVILLFARDAWSLPTFLPPSYRVSNAEKKCMRQKRKLCKEAMFLTNPNGHSIFRSSYRHDSSRKRPKMYSAKNMCPIEFAALSPDLCFSFHFR